MSDNWLEATSLHKTYEGPHGELTVLNGIDLSIAVGQFCAITGASGSGKSTLLNLLGRLDRPTKGTVRWGGEDLDRLGDGRLSRMRNREIGFVFQSQHLLGDFSALENILIPASVGGTPRRTQRERARELLREVGLDDRADHRPGELSGGEQQRIAVARALINSPKLLLADEPGGNLDRRRANELHDLLLRLVQSEGTAMVVVTHDPELAGRAHRWYQLEGGSLTEKTKETRSPRSI